LLDQIKAFISVVEMKALNSKLEKLFSSVLLAAYHQF
jgi:hypothetical protein